MTRSEGNFFFKKQITTLDLEEPEEWVDIDITNKDGK